MSTRILVVDDEETLRSVIGQVLREDGHEVVEAASAEQALELFRKESFPLVLTDIVMGKMSGLELLKEVKELDPECLVVIMTSHASLDAAVESVRSGAYDFLIKPFEDIDLISTVVYRAVDRITLMQSNRELLERLQKYAAKLEGLNEKLRAMANRDGVTGLYNHRYFREALDAEIARAERHERIFSFVFLDIDRFKRFNDEHGHLAGDALLRDLGELLQQRCRRSDIVARYGGEEFVLLLPETSNEGGVTFAQRLREAVAETTFLSHEDERLGQVTVSGGVSSYPDHAKDATNLIVCADRALYAAKNSGRNKILSYDEVGDEEGRVAPDSREPVPEATS